MRSKNKRAAAPADREVEREFHEDWIARVQPISGLVVSVPVLLASGVWARTTVLAHQQLAQICSNGRIEDLHSFFSSVLGLTDEHVHAPDCHSALQPLSLDVVEGKQLLRPSMVLAAPGEPPIGLVWDLGLDGPSSLDAPETISGTWDYPATAKFDRLLRHANIPIGILTNRSEVRLVYAPHGESSGHIAFRIRDMLSAQGGPIVDAMVMLLGRERLFQGAEERRLPALLAESRRRQSDVTTALADQLRDALGDLAHGFERAAERDGRASLDAALACEGHVYRGLLTVLLRLVFLLYAEDRGLLPQELPLHEERVSLFALHDELQRELASNPKTMRHRRGAWQCLLSLFRSMFFGARQEDPLLQPHHGSLFDPTLYPFVEGGDGALSVDDETVAKVLRKLIVLDGQRLSYRALDVEQIGSMYESMMGYDVGTDAQGRLVVQSGQDRKRTSSHYTPRSLSAPIVERALEPLLRALGPAPNSDAILSLKVCDPAMGSGAFLVEACRYLGDRLVEAWRREGRLTAEMGPAEDPVVIARRMVVSHCLYGVDRNATAVELAKLSLWLVTQARALPFSFLDHALLHGDSLVGLNIEQICGFHWRAGEPVQLIAEIVSEDLARAAACRAELSRACSDQQRQRLLADANRHCERPRLLADVIVGAFYFNDRPKAREAERARRLALAQAWLRGDGRAHAELVSMQQELREKTPAFHWQVELPEIFRPGLPRPFDQARGNPGFHGVLGNPPFLGGKRISTEHGHAYTGWLEEAYRTTKNADLSAYFFRRAAALVGPDATIGLIATKTIAQGDTRRDALAPLLRDHQFRIYAAYRAARWPGAAAVVIAIVHLARGRALAVTSAITLDDRPVPAIDSALHAAPERGDPLVLAANRGLAFVGCFLRGRGFILEQEAAAALLQERPDSPVRSFVTGEDVSTSPDQTSSRFVIDFADWSLDVAGRWPTALSILEQRVKSEREALPDRGVDGGHRRRWWQFAGPKPELRRALARLERCIVTPRVSKHLTFSLQPTSRVFSDQLCVFALDSFTALAILQSWVHEVWARRLCSTMGEGLRYTPTECVDTFPFPQGDPWRIDQTLETAGRELDQRRREYMTYRQVGLTSLYNAVKSGAVDCAIDRVRAAAAAVDAAVLASYGWSDLRVSPKGPVDSAVELEVFDRLMQLNAGSGPAL